MSRKTIPAQNIVICDGCGKNDSETRFAKHGHIKIKQDGQACAGASVEFDLCDNCLNRVVKSLNITLNEIKGYI